MSIENPEFEGTELPEIPTENPPSKFIPKDPFKLPLEHYYNLNYNLKENIPLYYTLRMISEKPEGPHTTLPQSPVFRNTDPRQEYLALHTYDNSGLTDRLYRLLTQNQANLVRSFINGLEDLAKKNPEICAKVINAMAELSRKKNEG